MTEIPDNKQEKRRQVLDRLRERFGEERDEIQADVEGLGILTLFLQPSDDAAQDQDTAESALTREDLAKIRRIRREQRQRRNEPGAGPLFGDDVGTDSATEAEPADDQGLRFASSSYDVLVEQIPQLRENLGEWLSQVDADFMPSSTSLEELRLLRRKTEFRLAALTVMVEETRRELDNLVVTIRATESLRGEDG